MTHTYVTMEVSDSTYKEVHEKLMAADYGHAINREGEMDMHGIALVRTPKGAEMFQCVGCDFEISADDAGKQNLSECPGCGSSSIPMSSNEVVTIHINWHELRILAIWAERWAIAEIEKDVDRKSGGRGTVYAIVDRIKAQCPEKKTPLTLAGEIQGLKDDGYDVDTNIPGIGK